MLNDHSNPYIESTTALSDIYMYIDVYVTYVRTFTATAHARRFAQTYVASGPDRESIQSS